MSIRTVLVPLLLAAFAQASVHAQTTSVDTSGPQRTELHKPTVSVPMDDWGGRPVVEARINGKGPFKLLIDTGTTFPAVLNDALVRKLKLAASGDAEALAEGDELESVEVDTLMIGDAEFSSFNALRSDAGGCIPSGSHGIVGILGLPLFEDCLLTLDFPKRQVRFESGKLPSPDGETVEYSVDEEHDYGVTVTVSLAGVPVKAHLDTGSPAFVTVLNKLQKELPLKGKPHVVGIARTPQGKAEVRSAVLDGVVKLGKHEWSGPRIDFADLGPMLEHDAGNIGSRLLREFAVTVDQKNRRARFRRGGCEGQRDASEDTRGADSRNAGAERG